MPDIAADQLIKQLQALAPDKYDFYHIEFKLPDNNNMVIIYVCEKEEPKTLVAMYAVEPSSTEVEADA